MIRHHVANIMVGERHRKDLGLIDGLAASIRELGLLHPVVITPDGELIAGKRRLRAVESLGWREIPVAVIDLDSVVRGRKRASERFHAVRSGSHQACARAPRSGALREGRAPDGHPQAVR